MIALFLSMKQKHKHMALMGVLVTAVLTIGYALLMATFSSMDAASASTSNCRTTPAGHRVCHEYSDMVVTSGDFKQGIRSCLEECVVGLDLTCKPCDELSEEEYNRYADQNFPSPRMGLELYEISQEMVKLNWEHIDGTVKYLLKLNNNPHAFFDRTQAEDPSKVEFSNLKPGTNYTAELIAYEEFNDVVVAKSHKLVFKTLPELKFKDIEENRIWVEWP